jgi:hypothetical protein
MRFHATTAAVTLCIAGCISFAADAIAAPKAKAPAAPDSTAASSPAKDDPTMPKTAPDKKEYEPPYPNRKNFFEPEETAVQPVVHSRQTILLKGFVSFPDEPIRAVMNINDKIVQLAAGESFDGVHIVSTEPPNATFKNEEKSLTLNLFQPDPRTTAKATRKSSSTMHYPAASEHTAGTQVELRLISP